MKSISMPGAVDCGFYFLLALRVDMWLRKGWQESQLRPVQEENQRTFWIIRDRQGAGTTGGGMGDGSG